ncbi:hypothetical protein PR048_017352 [Dryococelus australis]|uniref:Uncharacterized protein n=1 Tax=Dryococelus australis TaxID=614101 RepID=A0ABQ9H999_9NEOP|nr:hypothetical protein PR048_017352 [Dryococelus australis]
MAKADSVDICKFCKSRFCRHLQILQKQIRVGTALQTLEIGIDSIVKHVADGPVEIARYMATLLTPHRCKMSPSKSPMATMEELLFVPINYISSQTDGMFHAKLPAASTPILETTKLRARSTEVTSLSTNMSAHWHVTEAAVFPTSPLPTFSGDPVSGIGFVELFIFIIGQGD